MDSKVQDELEQLFDAVVSLAGGLRKRSRWLHSKERLSEAGRAVLVTLEVLGALTVPQLARNRFSSRQNMQMLTNRLAAAGWAAFVTNPDHKTSELVRLTEPGREMLRSANRRQAEMLASLLPHLSEDELRSCRELLSRIRGQLTGDTPRAREKGSRRARPRRRKVQAESSEPERPISTPETASRFAEPEELPVSLL